MMHGVMRRKTGELDCSIFNILKRTIYHCSELIGIIVVTIGISGRGKHSGKKGCKAEVQSMAQKVN